MSSKLQSGIVGRKKTKTENKEAQTPDVDKLKGELRKEIKQEFQKKDRSTHRRIQVKFERLNSGFNLYISKEKSRSTNLTFVNSNIKAAKCTITLFANYLIQGLWM